MREPARSYNHKIKVLLPEPNSAKRQQLADCLLLSLSISPAPHHRCHQPFVYFVFWKRNWKHKRSSYRTFSCLFSSPLRLCVCLVVCFLVMRGYGMKTAQQHDPPPSHPTSCGVRQPQTKKSLRVIICFCTICIFAKSFQLQWGRRRVFAFSSNRHSLSGCGFVSGIAWISCMHSAIFVRNDNKVQSRAKIISHSKSHSRNSSKRLPNREAIT